MKQLTLSHRFGICVRELRIDRGYTQEVFAERCGFFRTYLSRIETGKANPTLNAMEVIAVALDLSLQELITMVENCQP